MTQIATLRSVAKRRDDGSGDDAAYWLQKAADLDDPGAMASLGEILMNRDTGAETDDEAVDLLRRSFERRENSQAAFDLGRIRFWQDRKDPTDPDGAMYWLGMADLLQHREAGGMLASMGVSNYHSADGHEVPDAARHQAWRGDVDAMMTMAARQIRLDDVDGDDGALAWLSRAHDGGNTEAALQAVLIARSRGDAAAADQWAHKAIDRGDARGYNEIGVTRYFNGDKDGGDDSAAAWYRKAADEGVVDGCFNLGEVRDEQGRLEPDGDDGAIHWYRAARAGGSADAAARLAELGIA